MHLMGYEHTDADVVDIESVSRDGKVTWRRGVSSQEAAAGSLEG
jgi:hypothetical protein